jgi:hypothetical protein
MHVHPEQRTPEQLDAEFSEVTVRLKDGTELRRRRKTSERTGSPASPLTAQQLLGKYASCAKRALTASMIEKSADMIKALDALDDIGELIDVLTQKS